LPIFASPGELAQLVERLHGTQRIRRLKKLKCQFLKLSKFF